MMEQMDIFATEADRLPGAGAEADVPGSGSPCHRRRWCRPEIRSGAGQDHAGGRLLLPVGTGPPSVPGLPDDKYIWLNEIEPAEYWVMNDSGTRPGEHIDTCPFCGANLKAGGGDVLLVKADGGWWVVNGFLNESG